MMNMGHLLHLIDLLAKLHRKQLAKVKVAGTLPEWFRVKKGVRQGYVLSPYLFNILRWSQGGTCTGPHRIPKNKTFCYFVMSLQ